MAGKKRPSYLKRQKEQKRMARAAEKREVRRTRKQGRETEIEEPGGPDLAGKPDEGTDEAGDAEATDET